MFVVRRSVGPFVSLSVCPSVQSENLPTFSAYPRRWRSRLNSWAKPSGLKQFSCQRLRPPFPVCYSRKMVSDCWGEKEKDETTKRIYLPLHSVFTTPYNCPHPPRSFRPQHSTPLCCTLDYSSVDSSWALLGSSLEAELRVRLRPNQLRKGAAKERQHAFLAF